MIGGGVGAGSVVVAPPVVPDWLPVVVPDWLSVPVPGVRLVVIAGEVGVVLGVVTSDAEVLVPVSVPAPGVPVSVVSRLHPAKTAAQAINRIHFFMRLLLG